MKAGRNTSLFKIMKGQSMVEFAMILPLFVLFIIGIFELGRAFFAYIAITNAAREGARVITFWPGETTGNNVQVAVNTEIGTSPIVSSENITSLEIRCTVNGLDYQPQAIDDYSLKCESGKPVRVTITYGFRLILNLFFQDPIQMVRSAEMMEP